jgi:coproporphyrinogen III oxidase-like Fe-S oxidoreductase
VNLTDGTEHPEFSTLMAASYSPDKELLESRSTSPATAGLSIYAPTRVIPHYLWLLTRELKQKSNLMTARQPIGDFRLTGQPLTQFSAEELTELVFRLGNIFQTGNGTVSRTISMDPQHCSSTTLALVRGLGFTEINLCMNSYSGCTAADLETGIETIAGYPDFSLTGTLILDGKINEETALALAKLFCDSQSIEITVHWHDCHNLTCGNSNVLYNNLKLMIAFLENRQYQYLGDKTFRHITHPDISLQRTNSLRYGPWGYYAGTIHDWLGLGVSAHGMVGDYLFHNTSRPEHYANLIKGGRSAVVCWSKGPLPATREFHFIQQLYCHHQVNKVFFDGCPLLLEQLQQRGWLQAHNGGFRPTTHGLINLATICNMYNGSSQRAH